MDVVTGVVQNFPLVLLLVFGAVMVLTGLLLTVVGFSTLREWLASAGWPQVPAQIVASEVQSSVRFEDQRCYQPRISFTFAVEGGQGRSDRLAFVGKLYHREAAARKVLEKYPVGLVVMARCNPADPEAAVLERRGGVAGLLLLLFGLAMVLLPLIAAELGGLPGLETGLALALLAAMGWLLSRGNEGRRRRARKAGLYPPPGTGSDADVLRLIQAREKLLAIRLYRDLHGTDLKTAKERVEQLTADADRSP